MNTVHTPTQFLKRELKRVQVQHLRANTKRIRAVVTELQDLARIYERDLALTCGVVTAIRDLNELNIKLINRVNVLNKELAS